MPEKDTQWDLVGDRIRAARKAKGMSVRELARRIGVSASHVSQVERGIGAFSVPALYAVARELDVSMHSLLDPPDEQVNVAAAGARDLEAEGVVQRAGTAPSIVLGAGPRW